MWNAAHAGICLIAEIVRNTKIDDDIKMHDRHHPLCSTCHGLSNKEKKRSV